MDAHATLPSFDMNTLEGQRAAHRARRARMARPLQNLVMKTPEPLQRPAGATGTAPGQVSPPTDDAGAGVAPAATFQLSSVKMVPAPVMVVPGAVVLKADGSTKLTREQLEVVSLYRSADPAKVRQFREIEAEICGAYDVTRADLWSSRRQQVVCRARQEAYFRLKHETTRSLPEIGRRCGDRDHTTVLHGIRKVTELLATGWRMKTLPRVVAHRGRGYELDDGSFLDLSPPVPEAEAPPAV